MKLPTSYLAILVFAFSYSLCTAMEKAAQDKIADHENRFLRKKTNEDREDHLTKSARIELDIRHLIEKRKEEQENEKDYTPLLEVLDLPNAHPAYHMKVFGKAFELGDQEMIRSIVSINPDLLIASEFDGARSDREARTVAHVALLEAIEEKSLEKVELLFSLVERERQHYLIAFGLNMAYVEEFPPAKYFLEKLQIDLENEKRK